MKHKILVPNNTKSYVKKYKLNGKIEFRPVYFNSTTKAVSKMRFKKFCID